MSVYVFDAELGMLESHVDRASALAGRDPAGLREQRWLYFEADGRPLRLDLLADGSMQMRPWASCSSCTLAQLLPFVLATGEGMDAAALATLRERFAA